MLLLGVIAKGVGSAVVSTVASKPVVLGSTAPSAQAFLCGACMFSPDTLASTQSKDMQLVGSG